MTKRALDIVAAAAGLVLLSPLFAVIAVLVKLDSDGPILFRQERIGRGFRPFRICKFRTMSVASAGQGPLITAGDDPRVTRVGRVLRRLKLDELPQLVNVLKGEMSLVGPRPEVREYVELFRADYEAILAARPGITDLASIGYANEAEVLGRCANPEDEYVRRILPDKIRLSKTYLARASVMYDLTLLARTSLTLLREIRTALCGSLARQIVLTYRRPVVVAVHLLFVAAANYLAFWLRFDGDIPDIAWDLFVATLPWLLAIRGLLFVPAHLYNGLWRYAGVWDLRNIIIGVSTSTVVFYGFVRGIFGLQAYPRSVVVIDAMLLICMIGGVRLIRRFRRELVHLEGRRHVLIYGAGDAGEMITRDMIKGGRYVPVGFVDDDATKRGQWIHGAQVLGTRDDLPRIIREERPHEILVAMPGANPATLRRVVEALEPYKLPIATVPKPRTVLDGRVAVNQVRSLQIEDLLPRAPVGLDTQRLVDLIGGKCVLVTGAGGSIGSELCRQIAGFKPATLVLYERYENSLYTVVNDLNAAGAAAIIRPVIGDITDAKRLDAVMSQHRPAIVFHAAAHKHVPMMELNPCEAVKNNVFGTRMLAEAAIRFGVGRFILISSDKAVNPSSIMGATKRVAELVVQSMAGRSGTLFAAVRFGNVLGSNGSVVLRFLEQIKAGGPVTVTHPDITRYFMLIPEAVQLVLHAATLGRGGEIFVLDMGEQIKVLDLARNVIRLSGLIPDEDIPITFIGLRPGEKLYEELVGADETIERAAVEKIFRVRATSQLDPATLTRDVWDLSRHAARGDSTAVIQTLSSIVPTFRRWPEVETDVTHGAEAPAVFTTSALNAVLPS